ncbi:MAG: PGPGW domain-containing protein [Planctomycetota bacterium]
MPTHEDPQDATQDQAQAQAPSPSGRLPATAAAVFRRARQVAVFVLGVSVTLIGVAMIVLPGPAVVVIPAGLGILALEFAWARRLLRRVRRAAGLEGLKTRLRDTKSPSGDEPEGSAGAPEPPAPGPPLADPS